MFAQLSLAIFVVCCVLGVASAVVARAAARAARAHLRDLRYQMDRIEADFASVTIRLRRVEGRQTARIGRDELKPADGMPDPARDPEGWRAAVRKMNFKPTKGDLQ